ncbi:phage virion morphogenesis protein [bacterium]|nr:phage virion morphogenesis protein [bacterium]
MIKFKAHTAAAEHLTDLLIKSARGEGLESVAAFAAATGQRASKRSFLEASDPTTGEPWEPRRHEYPHPILRETGTLWADVIGDYELDGAVATVGIYVPQTSPAHEYAAKHQFGEESHLADSIGELPARPFAGMSPEDVKRIVKFTLGPKGLLQT